MVSKWSVQKLRVGLYLLDHCYLHLLFPRHTCFLYESSSIVGSFAICIITWLGVRDATTSHWFRTTIISLWGRYYRKALLEKTKYQSNVIVINELIRSLYKNLYSSAVKRLCCIPNHFT